MAELDFVASNVRKTGESDDFGYDEGLLRRTQLHLQREMRDDVHINEALQRVIYSGAGEVPFPIKEDARIGRVLVAADIYREPRSSLVGLLYAEGTKEDPADPAFSAVRMSMWISARKHYPAGNEPIDRQARDEIRELLLDAALLDIEKEDDPENIIDTELGSYWGIPVRSTTLITPVNPQGGDIERPFRHKDQHDMLAIAGLDVPTDLRLEIAYLVTDYHERALKT